MGGERKDSMTGSEVLEALEGGQEKPKPYLDK